MRESDRMKSILLFPNKGYLQRTTMIMKSSYRPSYAAQVRPIRLY